MRVLVTRPERDARKIAQMLEAAGHQVCLSPVLEIRETGVAIPAGEWSALVATSAHAFEFLDTGDPKLAALRMLPIFVVGERTVKSAQRKGFPKPEIIEKDAASLASAMILARPAGSRILYLAGADRKPGLEKALKDHGFIVEAVDTYRAVAAKTLGPEAVAKIRAGELDAVLHFSRRSAGIFVDLVDAAGLAGQARALHHVCLSEDVAGGLRGLAVKSVWPSSPNPDAMLQLLDRGEV